MRKMDDEAKQEINHTQSRHKPHTNLPQDENFTIISTDDAIIQQAKKLYDQHIAPHTRRVYASDWKIFKTWCQEKNLISENTTPEDLALFLTSQFQKGLHPQPL